MSSRALKKLYGKSDLDLLSSKLKDDEDEEEDDEREEREIIVTRESLKKKKKEKKNKGFSFADVGDVLSPVENPIDEVEDEKVEEEEEDEAEEKEDEEVSTSPKPSSGTKKKKKKKGKRKAKEFSETNPETTENIDDVIREVCGQNTRETESAGDLPFADYSVRYLLQVEHKNLNPENEMKKIFGSKVVAAEQKKTSRRRGFQTTSSFVRLVAVKPEWPPVKGTGMTMEILETTSGTTTFIFRHNSNYQNVQLKFWEAVDSMNPENVMDLVRRHPYHVDSLIQLSEMCRIQEDSAMAAELIQRSLYSLEASFHPSFSLTSGKCRISFKYRENRGLFLALFYHIGYVSKKGCHRTALEFCKLLYSLDPESDPFACLLLIDFLSLRSSEFAFLLRFFNELETTKNLSQLPNFAFSVALAQFHLEMEKSSTTASTPVADDLLQSALLQFPTVLHHLLDKCSVAPDPRVEKHPHFVLTQEFSLPRPLNQLVKLYAARCYHCWKDADVVLWLERNTRVFMDSHDAGNYKKARLDGIAEKRNSRFVKTPRNVSRHVIVSDIKDTLSDLPPELKEESINTCDPLPPVDGVNAYDKPSTVARGTTANYGDGGIISMFLRSLMPDFEVLNFPRQEAPVAAAAAPAAAVAAAPPPPALPRARRGRRQDATAAANAAVAGDDYEAQLAAAVAEADLLQEAVAGGAVGGVEIGGAGGAELRLGVNNLLDALRNLLTNLQPVANAEEDQDADHDEDEWSDVENEDEEIEHAD